MAKDKYISTPEQREASINSWKNSIRSLTNAEMKEWIISHYAFVSGVSRTKYSATIVVVGSDGEFVEITVSLPTKTISQ